jgi:hypothetical protein
VKVWWCSMVSRCGISDSRSAAAVCQCACSLRTRTALWLHWPGRTSQTLVSRHKPGGRSLTHIGTRRRERGANLAEAAVALPLLLIMVAVIADLGRAFFIDIAVIDAAREGARYGVTNQNATEMCTRALAEAVNQPLPVTLTCVANAGQGSGTPVTVTVSCNMPLIMGSLVGRPSILIRHTAAFRIR